MLHATQAHDIYEPKTNREWSTCNFNMSLGELSNCNKHFYYQGKYYLPEGVGIPHKLLNTQYHTRSLFLKTHYIIMQMLLGWVTMHKTSYLCYSEECYSNNMNIKNIYLPPKSSSKVPHYLPYNQYHMEGLELVTNICLTLTIIFPSHNT